MAPPGSHRGECNQLAGKMDHNVQKLKIISSGCFAFPAITINISDHHRYLGLVPLTDLWPSCGVLGRISISGVILLLTGWCLSEEECLLDLILTTSQVFTNTIAFPTHTLLSPSHTLRSHTLLLTVHLYI